MTTMRMTAGIALLVLVLGATPAQAQLEVSRSVIGGGATSSAGGLSVNGTFGQPASGPLVSTGLALNTGFWVGIDVACPCEIDGNTSQVNIGDLLAYLVLWFDLDAAAEFDGVAGPVNVGDLLAYLACWFEAAEGECL